MDPLIIGPLDLFLMDELERRRELEHQRLDRERRARLSKAIRELNDLLKNGHDDHSH